MYPTFNEIKLSDRLQKWLCRPYGKPDNLFNMKIRYHYGMMSMRERMYCRKVLEHKPNIPPMKKRYKYQPILTLRRYKQIIKL